MNTLAIEATTQTPKIILDPQKRQFYFGGRSLPEDSSAFYKPVFEWIDQYFETPKETTNVKFELDYFNTSSAKTLYSILLRLEKVHRSNSPVNIEWFYDYDDEDMYELGEEYQSLFKVPIVLIEMNDE